MAAVDPYVTTRERARELGLDPASPTEWGPFKMRCPAVEGHGRSVVVTDGLDGRAVFHCDQGCKPEAVYKAMGLTWRDVGPPPENPKARTAPAGERTAVWTKASDVKVRAPKFLWRPWVPLGKLTILAGAPGQGKSQLTAWLAANVTRAAFTPGDVDVPGNVVIMTAEDDLADTVTPRLMATNADLARVEFVNMRRTMPGGITTDGLIKLPGDVETLQRRLEKGDVRLVVIDPVASFIGRENSTYVNQDVREVLDPIVWLAATYNVAVVIVLHLNKSEAKTWAMKIGESHAFQAVARTVLVLAPDPDDEDGESGTDKVLAITKANIARVGLARGMRLRVRTVVVEGMDGEAIESSVLDLMGLSTIAADDLLSDATERGSRRDTLELLLDVLTAGPMESKPLQRAAKEHGVSWRSVQRYYREVCKPAKPAMSRGPWVYELQDRHLPGHTGGEHGALEATDVDVSANYATGVTGEPADTDNFYRPLDGVGELGGQKVFDLAAYRREEDRRLGERDDDDDD